MTEKTHIEIRASIAAKRCRLIIGGDYVPRLCDYVDNRTDNHYLLSLGEGVDNRDNQLHF